MTVSTHQTLRKALQKQGILISGMILITMLAILISGIFAVRSNVRKRQVQVIDTLTLQVEHYISETEHVLHVAGHSIFDLEPEKQTNLLSQIRGHYPRYENLLLLSQDGKVLIEESDDPYLLNFDMTGQPYYQEAINAGDVIISEPFVSISSNLASVTVAYPIRDGTQTLGMLVGEMDLALLQGSIEEVDAGKGAYSFILDQRGVIIAHPFQNWVQEQRNLSDLPIVGEQVDSGTTFAHFSDPETGKMVIGSARYLSSGWLIATYQPVFNAYAAIFYITLVSALGFGLSLVIFVIYQIRNVQRISRPLAVLAQRTVDLVSTPYEPLDLDESGNFTEIISLTQSFDEMASELHERDKHLEEQVKIRSAEIVEKSEELEEANQTLQKRSRDLSLMNDINSALLRGDSIKTVIEIYVGWTKKMYSFKGVTGAAVNLISQDGSELVAQNVPVDPKVIRKIERLFGSKLPLFRIPLIDGDLHTTIIQERMPRTINDKDEQIRYLSEFINETWINPRSLVKQFKKLAGQVRNLVGIESIAVFPLIADNKAIGSLEFINKEPFSLQDMERLETLSNQLAVALKRAQDGEEILAEKNFSTDLIDSLPGIFYVFDQEGKFLRWNKNLETITGFSTEQMLKAHPLDLLHQDDQEQVAKAIGQAFNEGYATVEGKLITTNGPIPYFYSGKSVMIEGKGYLMGSAFDISERVEAEDALKQRSQELERSNQDLERFAFIASHDLQEPLRKIQSFGDRLADKYQDILDDRGRNYLLRMIESARRNQEMVDDLLIYSRISTSYERTDPVNLNQVLKGVLENLHNQIEITNATINAERLPIIYGDRSQITQLIQHLIDNSLKFKSEDRDPLIQISAENGLSDQTVISFTDNGIGLDPKYTDKIFQPFQRLHGRDLYPGSGIGLAICKRIIEQHQGKIEVKSIPDVGTTILLSFPKQGSKDW
jgi:PAS domain S-box-containing protein